MRIATAFLFLALAFALPVRSEEVPSSQPLTSAAQSDSAHELLQVLMFETGILQSALDDLVATALPELRERVARAIEREDLSAAGQAALNHYVETLPEYLHSELRLGAGELIETTAPQVAYLFSVAEWNDIAAFLRQPEAGSALAKLSRGERSLVTSAEVAVMRQFYETPSGQAYARNGAELNQHLFAIMERELPQISSRMVHRAHRRLCEALADECPQQIRALIEPI